MSVYCLACGADSDDGKVCVCGREEFNRLKEKYSRLQELADEMAKALSEVDCSGCAEGCEFIVQIPLLKYQSFKKEAVHGKEKE